jgi:hypothetical protein
MQLHHTGRASAQALCLALGLACSPESSTIPPAGTIGAYSEPAAIRSVSDQSFLSSTAAVEAQGTYHFVIPADFNGGIFGVEVGNHVSFVAQRLSGGEVTGRFRYVQTAAGEDFIFSGTVTCLNVYDTPVLQRFESIPAASHNRAKWGGIIEQSNDPTLPAGGYLWFQSIDNNSGPEARYADLSTLSGFGNQAANEAFCNSANVPNPNFGPHAVTAGNVIVR